MRPDIKYSIGIQDIHTNLEDTQEIGDMGCLHEGEMGRLVWE